jgi:hypothetical protein
VALSKAELRTLALPGIREKINWHKSEIARLLEEAPELMTRADEGTVPSSKAPPPPRDPSRPKIQDQVLNILLTATKPMKGGDVFRIIQTLPTPSTTNDTSVYASLSAMAGNPGLVSRSEDGYKITAKGRKYLESLTQQNGTPGGPA